jgi:hydroxyacylglutathione hydrolase
VIFKQYRYEPLGQASYIVGCMRSKKAFVVDPIADLGVDHYVLEAADLGLTIVGILETHIHADFVSCARELAEASASPHYLHEEVKDIVRYDFTPVSDGQVLELGKVRVEVLHTPGHTPEHVCYLVFDGARAEEPWAVLTGDSLFVGDVGRPDLLLEDQALNVLDENERALAQYASIKERLFRLPDHVEVWPGHYGGSTCGGVNMSGKASSTIYYEKHHNLALAQPDASAFARFVKETVKPFPDNYAKIKSYNLGLIERDAVIPTASPGASIEDVEREVSEGAIILDVRPPLTFAREHIPGSVNLQFNRADLADRAEMALPDGMKLVIVGDSDATATAAVEVLRDAGFWVIAHLAGGSEAWRASGRPTASMRVITVDDLHARPNEVQVIDARERFEYRYAHIPGARLLPSVEAFEAGTEVDDSRPLAVVCGDQVRSATVASILMRAGKEARLVSGGMTDWLERGYPTEKAS